MPKTTGLYKTAEQMEDFSRRASCSIIHYMKLRDITDEKMAKSMNVQERTIQNRIKDPGSISLRDLWKMAIIMKCSIGELAGGEMPHELIGKWVAEAIKKEE